MAGGAALALALLFTSAQGNQWTRLALFLHPTEFGVRDPVFARDVAFYVFELPFWQLLQAHALVLQ